jgi:hypothetical protein
MVARRRAGGVVFGGRRMRIWTGAGGFGGSCGASASNGGGTGGCKCSRAGRAAH